MKECANDGCWDLHEVRVASAWILHSLIAAFVFVLCAGVR